MVAFVNSYRCRSSVLLSLQLLESRKQSSEMALVRPDEILTYPSSRIVFNAPFDVRHTYHIKIVNVGDRRIGWRYKNARRCGVDPPCGVLDPNESALMAVWYESSDFEWEQTHNDPQRDNRITIWWVNAPEGATKQFRSEWFWGDIRRKNLAIEYNP
ncbi:MSP (Major sperm protein) domain-containing protein [Ditylenchus destructor]|uniref:Major sperm protein n=1 Tax=Ditylenchus destructor TaxID=166010 RepID=A0AAD4MFS4_9BILA|nr:MSP (Major sperm protein) domain-containing protein [Ditylenchus destructor]